MGYEINLGNGEWATGQGGMAMTVTDTDTGVKEAVLMGCDRNSVKTAVNKDGLLYDVLPYEPSVTYIDGVGVLNNEPQSETRVGYTERNFEDAYWTKSRTTVIDENISINGSFFSKLTETSETGLHGLVRAGMGADIGVDCCFSVKVKKGTSEKVGIRFGNQVSNGGGLVVLDLNDGSIFSNENPSDLIPYIESFQNGVYRFSVVALNTLSATQMIHLSLVDENGNASYTGDANNYVYFTEINIVNESTPTSYIRSLTSATATRLADTGFKTPDLSKWIDYNGSKISFTIKTKPLITTGVRRVSLGTSSVNNIGVLFLNNTDSTAYLKFVINSTNIINDAPFSADLTKTNEFKIEISNNKVDVFVDDILVRTDTDSFNLSDLDFNKIFLDRGNGADTYFGETESIKIES